MMNKERRTAEGRRNDRTADDGRSFGLSLLPEFREFRGVPGTQYLIRTGDGREFRGHNT